MKLFTKCLVFATLMLVCSISNAESLTDSQLKSLIVGKWKVEFQDGPVKVDAIDHFTETGKLISKGIVLLNGQKIELEMSGVWEIKKGFVKATLQKTNRPDMLPPGHISTDQILSIDKNTYKYKNESGKIRVYKRIKK